MLFFYAGVLYDHGCALDLYALHREPLLMMLIRILIDRLHFKGHVACSPGYNINEYTHDPMLSQMNSMAMEQFFGYLSSFASTIRYMGTEHLMLFLQFLVHSWNASN
jgi:hypothetical protein